MPSPGLMLAGLIVGILSSLPGLLRAAWVDTYGISASVGYDNNYRLTESNEIETTIATLGFSASTKKVTQTTGLEFTANISGDQYSDSSIDETSELGLLIGWNERFIRSDYSIGANYTTAPTTRTELLDTGETIDGTRDSIGIKFDYSYAVSQTVSINTGVGIRDVSYDTNFFTDYQENSISLGVGQQIDQSSSWSYSLSFRDFEPEDNDTTETVSANIGYQLSTSVNTSYDFTIGYSDVSAPDSSEEGATLGIGVNSAINPRDTLTLDATRDFQASGAGNVREQDTIKAGWNRRISDRFGMQTSLIFLDVEDRSYESLEIGFGYQWTPELNLSGLYRYRHEEDEAEKASSDSVFLNISAALF